MSSNLKFHSNSLATTVVNTLKHSPIHKRKVQWATQTWLHDSITMVVERRLLQIYQSTSELVDYKLPFEPQSVKITDGFVEFDVVAECGMT